MGHAGYISKSHKRKQARTPAKKRQRRNRIVRRAAAKASNG